MRRFVIALCLGLLTIAQVQAVEPVFYASFDRSIEPEKSAGKAAATTGDTAPARFIPGVVGQAVVVAPRSWVSYSAAQNLKPDKGSISFLARPVGWGGNDGILHFFLKARSPTNDWIIIYKVPENKLQFTGGNAANYSYAEAPAENWKDGQWKHICVTWAREEAALYVDGAPVAKARWPVLARDFGDEFMLGGTMFGESTAEQAIDELKIYSETLSAEEVAGIFAKYKEPMEQANTTAGERNARQSAAHAVDVRVLLSASLNNSIDAQHAQGVATAKPAGNIAFTRGIRDGVKAVLLGRNSSLAYPLSGNLNPIAGTMSFWIKPVGWSGGDGGWHYMVRMAGDDDWILVQTVSNSLIALGGTRQQYSQNSVPIADWSDGVWRHVAVTWDNGLSRIYFDGKPVTEARTWPRVPVNLGNEIILGGQLHGDSKGQIAVQDFEIRDAALSPAQVEAMYLAAVNAIPALLAQRNFVKQQQVLDPLNIATPAYGAILLPSSQAHSSELQIEKACDGDFETHYLSDTGSFPNWVEIRWPQPAKINKLRVNESPDHQTAKYRIDAHVNGGWKTIVPETTNTRRAGEQIIEMFDPVETSRIRFMMLAPATNDARLACSLIQEIQACSAEPMPDFGRIAKPAWKSHWIWFPEGDVSDVTRYFRAHVQVDDPAKVSRAVLQIGCDDAYEAYINGQRIGSGGIPTDRYEVRGFLKAGDNIIAIKASQFSGFAGLICELAMLSSDGIVRIASDHSWKTTKQPSADWKLASEDESSWQNSAEHGIPPNCPDHGDQAYYDEIGKDRFILGGVGIAPDGTRPGQFVELNIQASIAHPTEHDYAFEARIGERKVSLFSDFTVARKTFLPAIPTSQWKPGQMQTLTTRILLPDWSPHGSVPLFLTPIGPDAQRVFDGADADGVIGQVNIRRFDVNPIPWPTAPPTVKVQPADDTGHAKLLVNGRVLPPQILTENSYASYQAFGEQAKTGIHLWRIYATRGRDSKFYPNDKERERAELCRVFDAQVDALLKVDPDAYILIGTTFNVSQEWTDQYPDDATQLANGNRVQHSFSSRRWIKETRGDIDAIVKHLMSRPYAGHVIGLHFGIGDGPETYYWGLNANPYGTPREKLILGDFSPEHIAAFRRWLRRRYAGNEQALRSAWKSPDLSFDNAGIDLDALRRQDLFMFRDPAVSRSATDYWEFHSDVMAQRVIDIAGAIKHSSGGRYITGFWGLYSNGMNALSNVPGKLQHSAYAGLQKALESKDIDYIAMLQEYLNVRWGTPMVPDNLTESIRRHGKLCLIEYDMRTFFTPVQFTERTFSQQETLSVMWRDISAAAVHGDAFWWVGFPQGTTGRISVPWFAEESILDTLAHGKRVYDACYRLDLRSASEVAVFANNADVYVLDSMTGHHLLASTQYNTWANELTKLGAPFDQYQLDDISLPAMDQYKVYIFLNAFNIDDIRREKIRKLLEKPGKTVVWLYAPGFSDGNSLSVDNIRRLTGFKVEMENRVGLPEAKIDVTHRFTAGVSKDHVIRPHPYEHHAGPFQIGPIFDIVDDSATPLGHYTDTGKVACAFKTFGPNNRAIYMAIPYLDSALARSICRAAGVHLYSENDIYLDASRRLLTITSTAEGYHSTIQLPQRCAVYDIFNKRQVASDTDAFQADVPPLTTVLYFVGPAAEMIKLDQELRTP